MFAHPTPPTAQTHAAQSWVHGRLLHWAEPAAVAPFTSWGFESPASKRAMRMTVLLSDLLGE